MSNNTQPLPPIYGPLRRLVRSVFFLIQTRLELFGIELAEEKERLLCVLFAGLAAMMFATMGLITLTILVTAAFWETYRWQVLAIIAVLYLVGAFACMQKARFRVRQAPLIFEETLSEFDKDRTIFQKPSP
ncbi:phage holin family protein [Candidatus Vallotia cooleyia]|uniref:phage holin family protein n=1 Tax=Candidatus Vallotiella adelgis TaxID=1177211 RepID=UPI001D015B78|nr:phage holin family protein [Candidatus Vallotia cooleyia]